MPLPSHDQIKTVFELFQNTFADNKKKFKQPGGLSSTIFDPMSITLHTLFSGIATQDDFLKLELARRTDKAFSNKIGHFHEIMLSSVAGWTKPKTGFDLKCDKKKIIVEIKNKYNTMNASSQNDAYETCYRFSRSNPDWTVYMAYIIPKHGRMNKPWSVPGREANNKIRLIDGASLYDMVMNESNALLKVYKAIPKSIESLDLLISDNQLDVILKAYKHCYETTQ